MTRRFVDQRHPQILENTKDPIDRLVRLGNGQRLSAILDDRHGVVVARLAKMCQLGTFTRLRKRQCLIGTALFDFGKK